MEALHVYDTTLRDGAQQEGLNLSVSDKLAIAGLLDDLGVDFIEGGWPGANPKDTEFFERAKSELHLRRATLAAFGATRRAGGVAAEDTLVRALVDSGASVVCLVAKSHVRHVEQALRTTLDENLAMVRDTVGFLVGQGRRVFLDCEHFFDGWHLDRDYALSVVRTAHEAGAEVVVLCDTNGGMLPHQVEHVVADVIAQTGARVGAHCHNDTGCAAANSVAAVRAGATHVQGTVNGYGERTGNADLITVAANLQFKLGLTVMEPESFRRAMHIAHAISEVTNVPAYSRQPYVGASAFAHKAGLHASALKVDPDLYQHMDPALVGNGMRTLVSDMAGRASIELKAREAGLDLSDRPDVVASVLATVKDLELKGWTFDAADATVELMLREALEPGCTDYFSVESWRVITDSSGSGDATSEATVKLHADGMRLIATGEGNGPVNALDHALRDALSRAYPEIEKLELIDFKVRILDASHGTDAVTRVLIETSDGETSWDTIGVAGSILAASWRALTDGIVHGLIRQGVPKR
ncbi:transferase [Intrasporangium oryzae NRRL B-24470]|uniref:Citramalate synthase n=1 Tax=Intrasporangium oryzae NRRL B-24470 TaxID=1386089 RepID=W9G3Z5_9MICO|nr:citramalate synthase [Intrasporangium oryzae]EWT00745.1 transferase [Intrasporangium oryzae NRRL B-24470]